jgi:hypothetical protein
MWPSSYQTKWQNLLHAFYQTLQSSDCLFGLHLVCPGFTVQKLAILTETFDGFLQSFQANTRIILSNNQWPHPAQSFPVNQVNQPEIMLSWPHKVRSWKGIVIILIDFIPLCYDKLAVNLYITIKHNKFIKSNNTCYMFRSSSTIFVC